MYETGGIIPKTNVQNPSKLVTIRNFRPLQDPKSFDEYGFLLMRNGLNFMADDFQDERKVEELFWLPLFLDYQPANLKQHEGILRC